MFHLLHVTAVLVSMANHLELTSSSACIIRDVFGSYKVPESNMKESQVYRYTLTSGQVKVQVMEYGATITAIYTPDSKGEVKDIVLGYDTLEGFFNSDNPYFGATVGRVANRIGGGQFVLDGVTYQLYRNDGNNTLHGGLRAFDKKLWTSRMEDGRVVMEYTSADGEEGFPGSVTVSVTYSLTHDNTLVIEYKATSTKRTPINLTNHAYFNLAGQEAGAAALYKHIIIITADHITDTNAQNIPTGKLTPVQGTPFDLRQPKTLGEAIKQTPTDGFDNNFVLPECRTGWVAVVDHPDSGRRLQVETTQPGLQLYTSNSITSIQGKARYTRHAALALEAQNFPDAINHQKEFPNTIYGPGDVYHQVTKYKFGVSSVY